MAERRMFAKTIIDSDAFTEMPLSTQALYFHLSMRADDDGFLNCAQKIMRMIGAAKNDFDLLLAKRFVVQFGDGICVIKHWRIHNYIQSDRYKPTVYQEEKALLDIKGNGSYTLKNNTVYEMDTRCIQDGYNLEAQDKLGKYSLVKDSLSKDSLAILCEPSENSVESKDEELPSGTDTENKSADRAKSSNPVKDVIESVIDECLNYLNLVSGKSFKITTESNRKFVRARINEDYTMDDFKRVIDNQWLRWKDSDMVEYMRPSTLFNAEKFQSYINAPDYSKQSVPKFQNKSGRFEQIDFDKIEV